MMQTKRGFVLAVSAPSGTGKTSLCDRLAVDFPFVTRSVSVTTRPKREGEVSGRDYTFVSPEEFQSMERDGLFLETAKVFDFYYGTPVTPVKKAIDEGRVCVMDIDTVGAFRVRDLLKGDSVLLFIFPPSLEELETRLIRRGKNSSEELKKRLSEAKREMSEASSYDYCMINHGFDDAYSTLKQIVLAERCRAHRLALPV